MSPKIKSLETLISLTLIILISQIPQISSSSSKIHKITLKSPNLYPESLIYDPTSQHFLISSLFHRTISSVSDAGVIETLIHDPSLPENTTILGLALHPRRRILLAVIHRHPPHSQLDALAAYDLTTRRRLFLTHLNDDVRPNANDVAVDFDGNAYVTNSAGNFVWKVDGNGEASVLSRSKLFTKYDYDKTSPYSECGLNGVVYVSRGYLLVVQSNTGKLFKVDVDDGQAREVLLTESLVYADGMAMRRDGVLVVVSHKKVWLLKSNDSWSQAVVYDRIELDEERFASGVAVKDERRVYVLYGHVVEGISGENLGREVFGIEEVRSEKERKEEEDDNIWIYILVGLGMAYFLVWRFQMKRLITNMDKKIS